MKTWRTLSDGRIEVMGEGVPTLPNDWQRPRAAKVWTQWGPLLAAEAERANLPRSWLLAVVCIESNGDANAEGAAGEVGLMQLMPAHWGGRTAAEMKVPQANVRTGASLLATIAARAAVAGELPKVASEYNCGADKSGAPRVGPNDWGMCCAPGYIDAIVNTSNYAIASLGLTSTSPASSPTWGPFNVSTPASSGGSGVALAALLYAAWRWTR